MSSILVRPGDQPEMVDRLLADLRAKLLAAGGYSWQVTREPVELGDLGDGIMTYAPGPVTEIHITIDNRVFQQVPWAKGERRG